jgi:hypothetical protein
VLSAVRRKSTATSSLSLPTSTSSCSSAECDSDSDFTDEEVHIEELAHPTVPSEARKLIKYFLCKVQWHLYSSSIMHYASSGHSSPDPSAPRSSRPSQEGPSRSSNGKRRAADDEGGQENNEDGHSKKRRKLKPGGDAEMMAVCRFACPFFKHDPQLYSRRRSCPGPGWPTVHRMKYMGMTPLSPTPTNSDREHLYRAHAQPIQCPRCYKVVETDADLFDHLRGEPCEVSAPQAIEGISREQLKVLRKRAAPCRLEEEKWRDVYRLLYPTVLETEIPSPCKLQGPLL